MAVDIASWIMAFKCSSPWPLGGGALLLLLRLQAYHEKRENTVLAASETIKL